MSSADLMYLFAEALERTDPAARAAYLDAACACDDAVRRRVEALRSVRRRVALEPIATGMDTCIRPRLPRFPGNLHCFPVRSRRSINRLWEAGPTGLSDVHSPFSARALSHGR